MIAVMPLLRLSAGLDPLFGGKIDFDHSIFARLTHLDVFGTQVRATWGSDLGRLPCLTHLSFNYFFESTPDLLRGILQNCKFLEVLVVLFTNERDRNGSIDEYRDFRDDPRTVIMSGVYFLKDWEMGVTGGEDYWIVAEKFIQKRRSGEIKGESRGDL
jgi:hypothetical protein